MASKIALLLVGLPVLALGQWYASTVALPVPMRDASSAIVGEYVAAVGGCDDDLCVHPTSTISILDPFRGTIYNDSLRLTVGMMGGHFAVSTYDPEEDGQTLFLFRACTRLASGQESAGFDEVVRVRVVVSSTRVERLEVVEPYYRLPRPIANASCVSRGSKVFIVGGVDLKTGLDRMTIDVVDVSRPATDDAFYVVGVAVLNGTGCDEKALHFPAVSSNNAALFIGLRCGTAPSPVKFDGEAAVSVRVVVVYPDVGYLTMPYETPALVPSPRGWGKEGSDVHMVAFASRIFLTGGALSFFTVGSPTALDTAWTVQASQSSVTGGFSSLQLAPMRSPNGNSLYLYAFGGMGNPPTLAMRVIQMLSLSYHTASILNVECEGNVWSMHDGSIANVVLPPFVPWSVRLSEEPQHSNVVASVAPYSDCAVRIDGFPLVSWMANKNLDFFTSNNTQVAFVCLTTGEIYRVVNAQGDIVGTYELRYAINKLSPLQFRNVPVPASTVKYWLMSGIAIGSILAIAVVFVVFRSARRRVRLKKMRHQNNRIQMAIDHILSTNKFEIISHIGSGGCGEVFKVRRRTDGRVMACKHIRCRKNATRDDIMRESDLLKRLSAHPNTVRIIETILTEHEVPEETSHVEDVQGGDISTTQSDVTNDAADGGYGSLPHLPLFETQFPHSEGQSLLQPATSASRAKVQNGTPPPQRLTMATFQCIVMEYCRNGDLASYVHDIFHHRGNFRRPTTDSADISTSRQSSRRSSSLLASTDERHGPSELLTESAVTSVALQLLYFLKYLHSRKPYPIVHGDLKPDNILIANAIPSDYFAGADAAPNGGRGAAKALRRTFLPIAVTDFACSQEIRPEGNGAFAQRITRAYTPPYISPECFHSGLNHVSCGMDVWAAGCIVYTMATDALETKKTVFLFEIARNASFEQDTMEAIIRRGYSPELARFLLLMLEYGESSRPTAEELLSCVCHVGVCDYSVNEEALGKLEEVVRSRRQLGSQSLRGSFSRKPTLANLLSPPSSRTDLGALVAPAETQYNL